jgi:hypothetical protein
MRLGLVAAALVTSSANMVDLLAGDMVPPAECLLGCAVWTDLAGSHNSAAQAAVDALWASAGVEGEAGATCAMPANFTGLPGGSLDATGGLGFDFSFGPQCFCAGTASAPTSAWGYCLDPPVPHPTQVNLQFGAAETELVAAFVTVDNGATLVSPPLCELCVAGGSCVNVTGTTVRMCEPQDLTRVLSFHNVPLSGLPFSTKHTYRVRGGTAAGTWAGPFTFTTRPTPGPSVPQLFHVVGDLGVYPFCSIGNFLTDAAAGDLSSSGFVHLGDHAYNEAMGGGARGDAYMRGLEPYLSSTPWLSVFGNHELEGSPFGQYCKEEEHCEYRYLNQTSGLLRTGAASGSGTNRWYSINIGFVHWVILDANYYLGLESEAVRTAQLEWLQLDLLAASDPDSRLQVPWIVIATHVPMYTSGANVEGKAAAGTLLTDLEPLMFAAGVDLYVAGHWHFYESSWPVGPNGIVGVKSFLQPRAPVHLVTGAGGAPSLDSFGAPLAYTRAQLSINSYSRMTVLNDTHLRWQQVDNGSGEVVDEWTIVQMAHGPFAATAPPRG